MLKDVRRRYDFVKHASATNATFTSHSVHARLQFVLLSDQATAAQRSIPSIARVHGVNIPILQVEVVAVREDNSEQMAASFQGSFVNQRHYGLSAIAPATPLQHLANSQKVSRG